MLRAPRPRPLSRALHGRSVWQGRGPARGDLPKLGTAAKVGVTIAAAALLLAGCAGSVELEPEPSLAVPTTEEPTGPVAPAIALTPSSDLVTIETQNPADDALAVSQELFESAHVAILAPHDNTGAVWLASSLAAQGGIPVLLAGKFEGTLNAELIRLGVHGIITVGPVDLAEIDVTSLSIAPLTSLEDLAAQGLNTTAHWVEFTPGGSAVEQLQNRPDGGFFGPPPSNVVGPEIEPAGEFQPMSATKRVENVVMLVTSQAHVAALANAKAAGAELVEYRDEIASDTQLITELHTSQPESILTLGTLPGGDDVPWLLTAAIRGELLPTGTQQLFNPAIRYVGATADAAALDEPVAFTNDVIRKYEQSVATEDEGLVAPLVVIPFSGENPSVAKVRPMINYMRQQSGIVLIDITAPNEQEILGQLENAAPLLSMPHVGVTINVTAAVANNEDDNKAAAGVSVELIDKVTTLMGELVRERGLPEKLLALQLFQPEFLHGQASTLSDDRAVEIAVLMNGYGPQIEKTIAWEAIEEAFPETEHWGWVVYPNREEDWLQGSDVVAVQPRLDVIIYQ